MRTSLFHSAAGADSFLLRLMLAAAVCLLAPAGLAADEPVVVRVEEDWELVITEPDQGNDAPQITCVISPQASLNGYYAAFELNHKTQPSYVAGGMQLQLWNPEAMLEAKPGPKASLLKHAGETVRWTQIMRLDGNQLTFEIVNGTSQSWDTFGGQGYLKVSVATGLPSLATYTPDASVQYSGVGFASHRVASLVLKEVRWYSANGLVATDTEPRPVQ